MIGARNVIVRQLLMWEGLLYVLNAVEVCELKYPDGMSFVEKED